MKGALQLREATRADLPQLQALASECEGASAWTIPVWEQVMQSSEGPGKSRTIALAWLGDELAGFAVMHVVADEGELENMGVAPHLRQKGIGFRLCGALFSLAKAAGMSRIALEARESNHAALALYLKSGFELEGKRPRYYAAPSEDAFLLAKHL